MLVYTPGHSKRCVFCSCEVESPMHVAWILLAENVVELLCVLAEFLSGYSMDR